MGQAPLIRAALTERDAAVHQPPREPSLAASHVGLHVVAACRLAPCSWPNQRITLQDWWSGAGCGPASADVGSPFGSPISLALLTFAVLAAQWPIVRHRP